MVRSGDTMVLCTATAGNDRDVDFLPLTVDVEEKHYAAGKIPGSFFRREARAGEKATLTARMIDRPLRPALPEGLAPRDTARLPADVGGPRPPVRHPGDERRLRRARHLRRSPSPSTSARSGSASSTATSSSTRRRRDYEELEMDLIVSGTDEAILMVEAGADGVTEAEILDALDIAHGEIKKLVATMEELREQGRQGEDRGRAAAGRRGDCSRRFRRSHGAKLDEATQVHEQARAPGRDRTRSRRRCSSSTRRRPRTSRPIRERLAEVSARLRQAREGHHPQAHRRRQEAPRRPRAGRDPADRVRGRHRAARRTARRCSRAARRRSSPTSRSARPAWT